MSLRHPFMPLGLVYKQKSKTDENMERLELAHIKLEAALETSEKWQIMTELSN